MKFLNKVKMAVVVGTVMLAGVVAGFDSAYAAYTCPANSYRPGESVSSPAQCNVPKDETNHDLMSTLKNIINVIIGVVGFLAVVMIILGGISYTTSAGDASKVKKAKDTIMYGIIGLVIALLAFAIVNFVLNNLFATA